MCRTYNGFDINGLGYKKDGRGNICPVTIILPELAMIAVKETNSDCGLGDEATIRRFFEILEQKIDEGIEMLEFRYRHICSQSADSAKEMWKNNTMAGYIPEEGIESAIKSGTLALGFLDIATTLRILIGVDHTDEKGMELAKRILKLYSEKCAARKEEVKLNHSVYATPKHRWGLVR